VERLWRWCRRQPALAAALAAVAATLIIGSAVSTYFAMDASHHASIAKDNETKAAQPGRQQAAARPRLVGSVGSGGPG
jgi:hypothetical protein